MHSKPSQICGIDEAGRGPLAGPVVAACVILGPDFPTEILADSKTLTPKRRSLVEAQIKSEALIWALGVASAREIEQYNILQASLLAMQRAFAKVRCEYPIALAYVDGPYAPLLDAERIEPIVKGDASIPPIMAASILAKEYRDHLMRLAAKKWPLYRFDQHKGYPTKAHRAACHTYGLCPIHRRTFRNKAGILSSDSAG
ncbi:MAG TPA: ribonuclease HII [Sphaerochaeta sp.]|nr:ribonuclease HII [Sphaerochaeta sp.]